MKRFKKFRKFYRMLLSLILILGFSSCTMGQDSQLDSLSDDYDLVESSQDIEKSKEVNVEEDKAYYKMEEVAAYIHFYKKLPKNYLTKKEAKALGWSPKEKNLWDVTDRGVIGGDYFGNYEKSLPDSSYKEADVNYEGGARGPERLVYDDQGNIFYTGDHYETFERIY